MMKPIRHAEDKAKRGVLGAKIYWQGRSWRVSTFGVEKNDKTWSFHNTERFEKAAFAVAASDCDYEDFMTAWLVCIALCLHGHPDYERVKEALKYAEAVKDGREPPQAFPDDE